MMWSNFMPAPINVNTIIEKNQTFLCEMVDIKRNGYRHFCTAFNDLTYNFWSPWVEDSKRYIDNFAEHLKLNIKLK